mmetsp:Transcript_5050/g.8315  ORF Transcript_5050/g.8315 Transcript_5050/m.8315 type:complete len:80 (-) Transcript_5050:155-394(-)
MYSPHQSLQEYIGTYSPSFKIPNTVCSFMAPTPKIAAHTPNTFMARAEQVRSKARDANARLTADADVVKQLPRCDHVFR